MEFSITTYSFSSAELIEELHAGLDDKMVHGTFKKLIAESSIGIMAKKLSQILKWFASP